MSVSDVAQSLRPAFTGLDVADPELEACIVGKVAEWSFQPIRADQPIQKTLGFTSGF